MTVAFAAAPPSRGRRTGRTRGRWSAAVLVAVATAIAGGCASDGPSGADHAEPTGAIAIGLAVPPLDLDDVAPNIAEHYRMANVNHDVYAQIPCYCGCERSIGHRHLADCFVRSDGEGWDAHAVGCAVCTDESAMVRRLLAGGADAAAIRQSVIAEFEALAPAPTT